MKQINNYIWVFLVAASFLFYAPSVHATIPCPATGCPPGSCNFTSCGPNCTDRNKGKGSCPDCEASCPRDADEGGCGGAKDCHEFSVKCNCGNGSITCHRGDEGPPGPTKPPVPTTPPPTKPPATPTPVQPTIVVTIPQPSPNEIASNNGTNMTLNGKSWICLQTTPCTAAGASCKGGNLEHRTLVTTKKTVNGAKSPLVPNKMTYIFECLKEDIEKQYKCTTGNSALDKVTAESDFLSTLSSKYGYVFDELTDYDTGAVINQTDEAQVPKTDDEGFLGLYEWESETTTQIGRLMMSLQLLNEGDNISGLQKSQQLGTFTYGDENNKQVCILIKWDPRGIVFDADTLKPIEGAMVTLYRQNPSQNFVLLKSDEVFGGITNPVITNANGAYEFFVPNGVYKLNIEKDGFKPQYEGVPDTTFVVYDPVYTGGEIVTNGQLETRHISLKRISFIDETIKYLQSVYSSLKAAVR